MLSFEAQRYQSSVKPNGFHRGDSGDEVRWHDQNQQAYRKRADIQYQYVFPLNHHRNFGDVVIDRVEFHDTKIILQQAQSDSYQISDQQSSTDEKERVVQKNFPHRPV